MSAHLIQSTAFQIPLADESVHCVVTSPPYWGLRAYTGDAGMIGLEPTFDEHLANLVTVFREVRRVLRKDGTLWLNYGDAYAGSGLGGGDTTKQASNRGSMTTTRVTSPKSDQVKGWKSSNLKPKDLMMMPARVAMALQADGWWLRSEVVWHKPNPMPESCRDRPTSAHEKLFLLSKSGKSLFWTHPTRPGTREHPEPDYYWRHKDTKEERGYCPDGWVKNTKDFPWARLNRWVGHDYFYDAEAVRTEFSGETKALSFETMDFKRRDKYRGHDRVHEGFRDKWDGMTKGEQQANGANLRNVWKVATKAYSGAHFATFPEKLIEPCILAGTSEKGVCGECGAQWVREVKKTLVKDSPNRISPPVRQNGDRDDQGNNRARDGHLPGSTMKIETVGWQPTCDCGRPARPAVVLDPFAGSGTTVAVADRFSRIGIGCDIAYQELARKRIQGTVRMLPGIMIVVTE